MQKGGAFLKNRYLIALFIVLILFTLIVYTLPKFLVGERTLPNLFLEGIDVGNLTPDELRAKIDAVSADFSQREVKFIYDAHVKTLSFNQLGIVPLKEITFKQLSTYGKTGFIFEQWYYIFYTLKNHSIFTLQREFNREKAFEAIYNFVKDYTIKPQDAKIIISDDEKIIKVPAIIGEQANINDALEQLESFISEEQLSSDYSVKIAKVAVNPDITDEDIKNMHITGKIAEAITYFNPANKERTHNIKIASSKLNDYIVPPGAIFSFNDAVGPRTKEAGYKEAMVIVENEFEPGLGGGICQVSSTIYNAALKANLPIIERRRHSLLVDYVPPGLDATVVYGILDFKFKNNTDGYLWIKTEVNSNFLKVKLFGWDENIPNVTIARAETKIEPPVEYIEDPILSKGEEVIEEAGKVGYKVQVARILKNKDGQVLTREIISNDTYPPEKKVIRLGVADLKPAEPEEGEKNNGQNEELQDNPELISPEDNGA